MDFERTYQLQMPYSLLEKPINRHQNQSVCMIDLRAAYDHINLHMFLKVLIFRSRAPKLVSIFDKFHVHTGCRQREIESPVLFNIYMDFVLRC